jgi:protein SCO1
MFKVSSPTPTPKRESVKCEPLTRAVSGGCLCQHAYESRARVTIFRVLLMLQAALFPLAAPWPAWGHDESLPQKLKGAERRQVRIPVENFTLTDQGSRDFEFASLRGKVAIVTFAYTTCPDVCPLLTAAIRQVQESLSAHERLSSFFITITTDPEIDTPAVLLAYAQRYRADLRNWAFLTGDETVLRRVWKTFGVTVHRKARGLVDHTAITAVIDRSGVMRLAYVGPLLEPKALQQDARKLLQNE